MTNSWGRGVSASSRLQSWRGSIFAGKLRFLLPFAIIPLYILLLLVCRTCIQEIECHSEILSLCKRFLHACVCNILYILRLAYEALYACMEVHSTHYMHVCTSSPFHLRSYYVSLMMVVWNAVQQIFPIILRPQCLHVL